MSLIVRRIVRLSVIALVLEVNFIPTTIMAQEASQPQIELGIPGPSGCVHFSSHSPEIGVALIWSPGGIQHEAAIDFGNQMYQIKPKDRDYNGPLNPTDFGYDAYYASGGRQLVTGIQLVSGTLKLQDPMPNITLVRFCPLLNGTFPLPELSETEVQILDQQFLGEEKSRRRFEVIKNIGLVFGILLLIGIGLLSLRKERKRKASHRGYDPKKGNLG